MRNHVSARLLAALIFLCACGPFGYLNKVAKDATRAVADAKTAGAEQYAPYEYWGAVSYLEQAKILMAYSEYERSFDYGVRAKQLAEEAKRKAERRESGKTSETLAPGSVSADDSKAATDEAAPAPEPEPEPEPTPAAEGGGEK